MTTVLITGTNRGLGLEFVRQYAEIGARVHACARDPNAARDLQALARGMSNIIVHTLDVEDRKAVEALARELSGETIDILINNAGLGTSAAERARGDSGMDYDRWERMFRVNALAPFYIAQAFHDHLKRAKSPKLVTITSQMGSTARSSGGAWSYRSTKAAVNNIMHGLASQWGAEGITVLLFHPGWVKTDMGGSGAPLTPKESIAGMRKIIDKAGKAEAGRYLDYSDAELPW
jgi:NAD(P)-dependent dehydrogenase (short-subunit alcohol dehydrogenase family)